MSLQFGTRIAIMVDDELTIHMASGDGSYVTVCGLDENDPELGLEQVPMPPRRRIDCPHCWAAWRNARFYDAGDFTAKVRE